MMLAIILNTDVMKKSAVQLEAASASVVRCLDLHTATKKIDDASFVLVR
jgi:hypothetical protein